MVPRGLDGADVVCLLISARDAATSGAGLKGPDVQQLGRLVSRAQDPLKFFTGLAETRDVAERPCPDVRSDGPRLHVVPTPDARRTIGSGRRESPAWGRCRGSRRLRRYLGALTRVSIEPEARSWKQRWTGARWEMVVVY